MASKVCTVTGVDPRGLPATVVVQACSLFEAAAAGFEQLHRIHGSCDYETLQVTVHEPGRHFHVFPSQLVTWLGRRSNAETIGVTALKKRVQELIRTMKPNRKTQEKRNESG